MYQLKLKHVSAMANKKEMAFLKLNCPLKYLKSDFPRDLCLLMHISRCLGPLNRVSFLGFGPLKGYPFYRDTPLVCVPSNYIDQLKLMTLV